ncbi:MAG: hypothetical protein FWB98_00075 [Defluviitaleaceae bacterium]|nr:hypothetical protein [Defluviitaleaceae bacterium]
MVSTFETRPDQKRILFRLLKVRRDMKSNDPNIDFTSLDYLIMEYKTAMEEEDVALVEKNINSLK